MLGRQRATSMACVGVFALGIGVYNGASSTTTTASPPASAHLDSPTFATSQEPGARSQEPGARSQEKPAGWDLAKIQSYDWAKRFFGDTSTWDRYQYQMSDPTKADLSANIGIIVDVIETPDRAALSAYGVEQCYTFHGHKITGRQSVDLGEGLTGGMLTWTNEKNDLSYTTLYWHWPVKTPSGTQYERVTMVMTDQSTNEFTSPAIDTNVYRQLQLDFNDALRGAGNDVDRARLVQTRQFMINFAKEMVAKRQAVPTTGSAQIGKTTQ